MLECRHAGKAGGSLTADGNSFVLEILFGNSVALFSSV